MIVLRKSQCCGQRACSICFCPAIEKSSPYICPHMSFPFNLILRVFSNMDDSLILYDFMIPFYCGKKSTLQPLPLESHCLWLCSLFLHHIMILNPLLSSLMSNWILSLSCYTNCIFKSKLLDVFYVIFHLLNQPFSSSPSTVLQNSHCQSLLVTFFAHFPVPHTCSSRSTVIFCFFFMFSF